MYTYPNGLRCNASPTRVKAFEAIVPPITIVLVVVGFFVAARLFSGQASLLPWFVLTMTVGTLWTICCALASFCLFNFWCKPLPD